MYADEVIPTKRTSIAKPLLAACVVAVGFTAGFLANRSPGGRTSLPAAASGEADAHHDYPEVKEPPLWAQVFRPSPATARLILRMGLPMLAVADGSAQEEENRTLELLFTGRAAAKPETPFQAVLPFLRPTQVAQEEPPAPPPVQEHQPNGAGEPQPGNSTPEPAQEPPEQQVVNGGLPLVGIYHTHDWESYLSEFPALKLQTPDDLNKVQSLDHKLKTIVDIGRTLGEKLQAQGVSTVHAPHTHQRLKYDYAYQLSRETAQQILKEYPSVKILLDLHRDGAWGLDTTVTVKGERVAQIRCIIGTVNPHWPENKQFCDSLRDRLNKKYPGIALETKQQNYTYNQDLMHGAILLEIGNAPNSYAEAERAVTYLAEAVAELAREGAYPK